MLRIVASGGRQKKPRKGGSEERLYGGVSKTYSKLAEVWCHREMETSRMKMAICVYHYRRNNNDGSGI